MLIQDQFGIIQNLQTSPIPQTSYFPWTFLAVSYSKTTLNKYQQHDTAKLPVHTINIPKIFKQITFLNDSAALRYHVKNNETLHPHVLFSYNRHEICIIIDRCHNGVKLFFKENAYLKFDFVSTIFLPYVTYMIVM